MIVGRHTFQCVVIIIDVIVFENKKVVIVR